MTKKPKVYFISGVCGTGKTSTIVHLKNILDSRLYDVRDFDERGVPDGGGPTWHANETLYWLNIAAENAKQNKSTIISGFAEPEKVEKLLSENHPPLHLFLLHASADTIRKRLMGRYQTPESIKEINRASGVPLEDFIQNNVSYAPVLRALFEKSGFSIVETDAKTSEAVSDEIVKQILEM